MPRLAKILFVCFGIVVVLAGALYVALQWIQVNPLNVRVISHKVLDNGNWQVDFEIENASPFPVQALLYSQFEGPGGGVQVPWGNHHWNSGKWLKPGESHRISDEQFNTGDLSVEPKYFYYAWDHVPAYWLRMAIPNLRDGSIGQMPYRDGVCGPFHFEKEPAAP